VPPIRPHRGELCIYLFIADADEAIRPVLTAMILNAPAQMLERSMDAGAEPKRGLDKGSTNLPQDSQTAV
jgi:hypothetical protein